VKLERFIVLSTLEMFQITFFASNEFSKRHELSTTLSYTYTLPRASTVHPVGLVKLLKGAVMEDTYPVLFIARICFAPLSTMYVRFVVAS